MTTQNVNPTNDPVQHIPGPSVPSTPRQPVAPEMVPFQQAMQQLLDQQYHRNEALAIRQDEKFKLVVANSNEFGLKEGLILLGVVLGTAAATTLINMWLAGGDDVAT